MDIKKFDLEITLLEPMLGTVPKNKDVYATYLATRAAGRTPTPVESSETSEDVVALGMAEVDTVPFDENKGWTGFHTDDDGIFVYDYLVKGTIKEAGNVLKESVNENKDEKTKGIKNLKSKLDSYVFVFPRRIHFTRDNKDVTEPDDVFERPLRAMTMQGPRVTLVRSDLVKAGTKLKCEIRILPQKELNEKVLRELLDYGQYQGLGQFRNGSFGRFEYVLTAKE